MNFIQQVLTLDIAALRGWRTALGTVLLGIQPVLDLFTNQSLCASHSTLCHIASVLGGWSVIMGVRGAVKK